MVLCLSPTKLPTTNTLTCLTRKKNANFPTHPVPLRTITCVNARGVPLFYNRLHFLTKTTAQSTATPLAYDRDHIPPTAQQWVAREAEVRVKIDAAIAAATAAKTAAPTNLVVTVNTSSDDKIDATTMPLPIDVTVAIPWAAGAFY